MSLIESIRNLQSSTTTQAASRTVATPGRQDATAHSGAKVQAAVNSIPDDATLSNASVLISHALSQTDVRTDKVATIQKAIAAGTYHVSSSDLADKLIATLTVA